MRGDEIKKHTNELKKRIEYGSSAVSESKYLSDYIKHKVIDISQFAIAILVMSTRFITRHKLDVAGDGVANKIKKIQSTLPVRVFGAMVKNECSEYAGYLAYLNIFSLFSIIIVIISLFSLFGQGDAGIALVNYLIETLPRASRNYIESQAIAIVKWKSGLISLTFIVAVWTITSTLEGLRNIFNKMFKVEHPPFFLISRLASIGQVLFALGVMLVTIFTFVILPKILVYLVSLVGIEIPNLLDHTFLRIFISFSIVSLIIASIYRSLTNTNLSIFSVLPGAILTVSLWFIIAGQVFDFFYSSSEEYGDTTGVLLILLFLYLMNFILLYGMQLNYILYQSNVFGGITSKMNAIVDRVSSLVRLPKKGNKENKKRRQDNRRT